MSFSLEVKSELSRISPKKKCCMLAEIAGFLRVSSAIKLFGAGEFTIVAATENAAIARHYKKLIKEYFGSETSLDVGDSQMPGKSKVKGHNRYYLNISHEEKSMQILRETGMMLVKEGNDFFSDGIYQPIVKTKCCKKAYIRGMFLACGIVTDPKKSYQLEFVLESEQTALDLKRLIGTFEDLSANISKRKNDYVVYIKKSAYITDLLSIMGADSAVLDFEDIKISKEAHGEAQRLANCDNANVDRTLTASEEQTGWIKVIMDRDGIGWLPEPLREVAQARLDLPEASLAEIGESLNPPIQKPAVSKRFAKIKSIAESILDETKTNN